MPQLDKFIFFSQFFWFCLLVIVVAYLLLTGWLLPRILRALKFRRWWQGKLRRPITFITTSLSVSFSQPFNRLISRFSAAVSNRQFRNLLELSIRFRRPVLLGFVPCGGLPPVLLQPHSLAVDPQFDRLLVRLRYSILPTLHFSVSRFVPRVLVLFVGPPPLMLLALAGCYFLQLSSQLVQWMDLPPNGLNRPTPSFFLS